MCSNFILLSIITILTFHETEGLFYCLIEHLKKNRPPVTKGLIVAVS